MRQIVPDFFKIDWPNISTQLFKYISVLITFGRRSLTFTHPPLHPSSSTSLSLFIQKCVCVCVCMGTHQECFLPDLNLPVTGSVKPHAPGRGFRPSGRRLADHLLPSPGTFYMPEPRVWDWTHMTVFGRRGWIQIARFPFLFLGKYCGGTDVPALPPARYPPLCPNSIKVFQPNSASD